MIEYNVVQVFTSGEKKLSILLNQFLVSFVLSKLTSIVDTPIFTSIINQECFFPPHHHQLSVVSCILTVASLCFFLGTSDAEHIYSIYQKFMSSILRILCSDSHLIFIQVVYFLNVGSLIYNFKLMKDIGMKNCVCEQKTIL